jgi:serine protease Do
MAAYWDLDETTGIIINKVVPGSPAEKGGIKSGDLLISLGDLQTKGYDNKNMDVLRAYVRNLPAENVKARILRDQKFHELTIPLKHAPKSRFLAAEYSDEYLGIGVKELTQDYIINNDLKFDTEGVWVSRIEEAGSSSLGGININDLILKIDNHDIKNLKDFETHTKELQKSKDEYIQIFIHRNGKTRFVFIKTIHEG